MDARTRPPRRPMRSDARRNHDLLLSAAHDVFTEHGTDASLEEVARRAGVGIGTLYRHFPTRDTLLEALLHDRFESLRAEAERLLETDSPGRALADWLRTFTARTSTYRGLPASVMATMRSEGTELYTSCHAMRDAGMRLIVRAQRAKAIRDDVDPRDLLSLAGGIAWVGEQVPTDAGKADRLLSLVLDGLARPR